MKGDKKKFELWLHSRLEVYIIQVSVGPDHQIAFIWTKPSHIEIYFICSPDLIHSWTSEGIQSALETEHSWLTRFFTVRNIIPYLGILESLLGSSFHFIWTSTECEQPMFVSCCPGSIHWSEESLGFRNQEGFVESIRSNKRCLLITFL